MSGSFDGTLGSDPEHQDRSHRWLGVSTLHLDALVQKGAFSAFRRRTRQKILSPAERAEWLGVRLVSELKTEGASPLTPVQMRPLVKFKAPVTDRGLFLCLRASPPISGAAGWYVVLSVPGQQVCRCKIIGRPEQSRRALSSRQSGSRTGDRDRRISLPSLRRPIYSPRWKVRLEIFSVT